MSAPSLSTIKPSGGDYATMSGWEADIPAVLTQLQQGDLYNFGSGGLVEGAGVGFDGLTTTSAFRLVCNVPVGERHNGTAHSGAYYSNGGGSAVPIRLGNGVTYFTMNWFEVESTTGGFDAFHYPPGAASTSNEIRIEHSILHSAAGVLNGATTTNLNIILRNDFLYSTGASRLADLRGVNSSEASNITLLTNGGDFPWLCDNNASNVVTNCYAAGASNLCFFSVFCGTGSYNASSDGTATGCYSNSIDNVSTASALVSATPGAENLLLKAGSPLIDVGTTLAAVTDDIIGTSRPQRVIYDIGGNEYIFASAAANMSLGLLGVGQ